MKRRLIILGLFLLALAVDSHAQFVSGTVTSPNCYSGANLPSGTVLHLSNAIFYKATISKLTLAEDCVNVIFDHPTGSDVYITDKGKNDVFQYGSFGSTGEVLLQLIGDHGAANYCTVAKCAGRAAQVGGTNNLILGWDIKNACQNSPYKGDDGAIYIGQNSTGTIAYNRIIGCKVTGTVSDYSFYLDNKASHVTVQGCNGDKPCLINGGAWNVVYKHTGPIIVFDRQWSGPWGSDVGYVIGDQILSCIGKVTLAPTLKTTSDPTPRRQFVTVK